MLKLKQFQLLSKWEMYKAVKTLKRPVS
jgi:hypothetical protein